MERNGDSRFRPPPESGPFHEDVALPPFDASGLVHEREGESAVAAVLRRHGRALLELNGIQGYGIGRSPTGEDAIVVYLVDAASGDSLPSELEGVPVVGRVTGIIKAR